MGGPGAEAIRGIDKVTCILYPNERISPLQAPDINRLTLREFESRVLKSVQSYLC
jgi:hypothetical protein